MHLWKPLKILKLDQELELFTDSEIQYPKSNMFNTNVHSKSTTKPHEKVSANSFDQVIRV